MIIKAPWTREQVRNLRNFQDSGIVHPYTCTCKDKETGFATILIPTTSGWICPNCGYKQELVRRDDASGKTIKMAIEKALKSMPKVTK